MATLEEKLTLGVPLVETEGLLPTWTLSLIQSLRDNLQFLCRRRVDPARPVNVKLQIFDNLIPTARCIYEDGEAIIGLTLGLLIQVWNSHRVLITNPNVLEEVAYGSTALYEGVYETDFGASRGRHELSDTLYKLRLGFDRARLADFLVVTSLGFIMFHELCHIVHGHNELSFGWKTRRPGFNYPDRKIDLVDMKVFEWDADQSAVGFTMDCIFLHWMKDIRIFQVPTQAMTDYLIMAKFLSFGASLSCILLGKVAPLDLNDELYTKHPQMSFRMATLRGLIAWNFVAAIPSVDGPKTYAAACRGEIDAVMALGSHPNLVNYINTFQDEGARELIEGCYRIDALCGTRYGELREYLFPLRHTRSMPAATEWPYDAPEAWLRTVGS